MYDSNEEYRDLLKKFKNRWTINKIKNMKLEEYTDIRNEDTFCYWVESKTKSLGSIQGTPADKFGIFRRGLKSKNPNKKNHYYDDKYIWKKSLGYKDRGKAFNELKERILNVITCSKESNYEEIEKIKLHSFLKWKIAYLFSDEKLFPGFEKDLLYFVLKKLGCNTTKKMKVFEIQKYIYENRPKNMTIYEFCNKMWDEYNGNSVDDNDPDCVGLEGGKGKLIKPHLARERDSKFRNKYRKYFKHIKKCSACNKSAKSKYRLIDENSFLELHHIVPLKYIEEKTKITESDVTLLCPNCHRAIHKVMSSEQIKKISLDEFKLIYLIN